MMTVERLSEIVSDRFNVDLFNPTKERAYYYPRAILFKLAHDELKIGIPELAEKFNRTRQPIYRAIRTTFTIMEKWEPAMYKEYLNIKHEINKYKYSESELEVLNLIKGFDEEKLMLIKAFIKDDNYIQKYKRNLDSFS